MTIKDAVTILSVLGTLYLHLSPWQYTNMWKCLWVSLFSSFRDLTLTHTREHTHTHRESIFYVWNLPWLTQYSALSVLEEHLLYLVDPRLTYIKVSLGKGHHFYVQCSWGYVRTLVPGKGSSLLHTWIYTEAIGHNWPLAEGWLWTPKLFKPQNT